MLNGVIGLSAIQEMKKFFPDVVLAGGYVRDSILGGVFKDIDFFIPCNTYNEFHDKIIKNYTTIPKKARLKDIDGKLDFINSVPAELGPFTNFNSWWNTSEYGGYETAEWFVGKVDCLYMGSIPVQIMGHTWPNKRIAFADHLVKNFSYGIDQAYFDGEKVGESEAFKKDRKNQTATLLSMKSIHDLPSQMEKFIRLKQKYPEFKWRTDLLQMKEQPVMETKKKPFKSLTTQLQAPEPWLPRWDVNAGVNNRAAPQRVEAVPERLDDVGLQMRVDDEWWRWNDRAPNENAGIFVDGFEHRFINEAWHRIR